MYFNIFAGNNIPDKQTKIKSLKADELMDKNKTISIFSNYVKTFDLNNQLIAQKFQHSLSTANYSLDIADFLLLDTSLKNTAFLIGILHEFGSFEAIKTSSAEIRDKLTIKALFKENQIENFTQNKSEISLIKKTLQTYFSIPKNKQSFKPPAQLLQPNTQQDKVAILLSILMDADTLELFGRFRRNTLQPFVDSALKKESFSKKALESFRNKQKIQRSDISSNLDKALFFVSLFYDLNYSISKNIAIKIEFEKGIVNSYKPLLSETEFQKLERVINTFKKSLSS